MQRIITFFIGLVSLLFFACNVNNEQKKLKAEIRLFKTKSIILPDNMLALNCDELMEQDSLLLRRPLKMVLYINQDGCTGCKLRQLIPIFMFILENQNNENFGAIIILNTSDIEYAKQILKEIRFCKTVFYDLDGSFERLNTHLPSKEHFHTFLLNKENKVLLVGNPVHNEKLKKLYLKEIRK